jgi:hypothetical protein
VEDEIESTKGTGSWSSVQDRIRKRHQRGKDLCKKLGKLPKANTDVSYLTVDCDFQEVPERLPKREWRKFPDRGLQFVTIGAKEIIAGPKTQEEVEEEARKEQLMVGYLKFHKQHRLKSIPVKEIPVWKTWTPRLEEIEGDEWRFVQVKVHVDEIGLTYDWKLRLGLEWQDFRFLVNSKLDPNRWETTLGGSPWEGDVLVDGRIIAPFSGDTLTVVTREGLTRKKEKILRRKQEKWNWVEEALQDVSNWYLDYDLMEDFPGLPVADEDGFYVLAEFPNKKGNSLLQLPRGSEWAYFESLVSTELGQNQWIAAFTDGAQPIPWEDGTRVPRPGQRIRIFSLKDENKIFKQRKVDEQPRNIKAESASAESGSDQAESGVAGSGAKKMMMAAKRHEDSRLEAKPGRRKVEIYSIIPLKSRPSLTK